MKLTRKMVLTLSLVLLMLISSISPMYAIQMTDVDNSWAKDKINQWVEKGFISGYGDGTFKPDTKISRAEFISMINKAMAYTELADIGYKDVSSTDWFYKDVQIAHKAGYINGHSTDEFAPNSPITREEATAIIVRIKKLADNTEALSTFTDNDKISDWAKGAVGAAAEVEYVKGYADDTFKAKNNLTRAEAVYMLNNVVFSKNVIVNQDGQEVKDLVIEGKLIFTKSLGEGNATLRNVEVKGDIIVNGGGANSIYFYDSITNNLIINKETPTRVAFRESSSAKSINIIGNGIIDFGGSSTVENLIINTGETVILRGTIKNVTISKGATVILEGATIENITINEEVTLVMDKNSKVDVVKANQSVTINGAGTIGTLEANANGIKYEVKIEEIEVKEGVEEPEKITPPSGGGTGGVVVPNPIIQKVLAVKIVEGNLTITGNYEYSDNDTLNTFIVKNTSTIATAIKTYGFDAAKLNGKGVLSVDAIDKYADILEIDKNSSSYNSLITSDLKLDTIITMLVDKSDALMQHIDKNKTTIKANINAIDLSSITLQLKETTKTLDQINYSVKFGTETEITNLATLLDDLILKSNDLKTKTIDQLGFSKVVIKIGSITMTIERTTITK